MTCCDFHVTTIPLSTLYRSRNTLGSVPSLPIPREDNVYKGIESMRLNSKLLTGIVLGPPALVAEARVAFRCPATSLATPGERLAVAVDTTAVPILVASPAGFTTKAGSPHILTASVRHRRVCRLYTPCLVSSK